MPSLGGKKQPIRDNTFDDAFDDSEESAKKTPIAAGGGKYSNANKAQNDEEGSSGKGFNIRGSKGPFKHHAKNHHMDHDEDDDIEEDIQNDDQHEGGHNKASGGGDSSSARGFGVTVS